LAKYLRRDIQRERERLPRLTPVAEMTAGEKLFDAKQALPILERITDLQGKQVGIQFDKLFVGTNNKTGDSFIRRGVVSIKVRNGWNNDRFSVDLTFGAGRNSEVSLDFDRPDDKFIFASDSLPVEVGPLDMAMTVRQFLLMAGSTAWAISFAGCSRFSPPKDLPTDIDQGYEIQIDATHHTITRLHPLSPEENKQLQESAERLKKSVLGSRPKNGAPFWDFHVPGGPNDKAMKTEYGGIDFNAANLHLHIKRDGHGVPLPMAQQDMAQLSAIDGLEPVILSIQPAMGSPLLVQLRLSGVPGQVKI